MANKTTRQDTKLNERIAAIRENNARLENRHKVSPILLITPPLQEIEMDKRRAVETGSSILPSQIRQKQNYRYRGVGGGGTGIGYNLSKSLSRLHQDVNYNSQPQFSNNPSKGRGCCAKGNSINTFEYVRHVEIDRSGGRGKPQKYHQYQSNRTYYGTLSFPH
ncbi:unnamed protein product [Hydatigera taeniaeformis]|uniref:Uncharacterized protein n=1 Tax=Hydatigena taeniaeformis TaxID=6205 RepID=A0A0R3X393_HYDTA|nr:unnamed protein product [Hydatigera taeniaeformis]